MSDVVAKIINHFRGEFEMFGDPYDKEAVDALEALEAENAKLREALVKLNAAVDAFWNDPDRPSIAKMKSNSVYDVNEAQFRARAALWCVVQRHEKMEKRRSKPEDRGH